MSKIKQIAEVYDNFKLSCAPGQTSHESIDLKLPGSEDNVLKIIVTKMSNFEGSILVVDLNGEKLNTKPRLSYIEGRGFESDLSDMLEDDANLRLSDVEEMTILFHIYEYGCEEGTVEIIFSDPEFSNWSTARGALNSLISEDYDIRGINPEIAYYCYLLSHKDDFNSKEIFTYYKELAEGRKEDELTYTLEYITKNIYEGKIHHDNELNDELKEKADNLKIEGFRTKTHPEVLTEDNFDLILMDAVNSKNIVIKWGVYVPYDALGYEVGRAAIIDAEFDSRMDFSFSEDDFVDN